MSHVSKLKKNNKKKEEMSNKGEKRETNGGRGSVSESEGEKNFRERISTFSLRSTEIGS